MALIHYPLGESGKRTLCGGIWMDWPDLTSEYSEVTCRDCASVILDAAGYGRIKITVAEENYLDGILRPEPELEEEEE